MTDTTLKVATKATNPQQPNAPNYVLIIKLKDLGQAHGDSIRQAMLRALTRFPLATGPWSTRAESKTSQFYWQRNDTAQSQFLSEQARQIGTMKQALKQQYPGGWDIDHLIVQPLSCNSLGVSEDTLDAIARMF